MKTALLPATRIEPSLRRELQTALDQGETLSGFIESAVRRQIQVRDAQRQFIARGLAAERGAEAKDDWLEAADVLEDVSALASRLSSAPRRRAK